MPQLSRIGLTTLTFAVLCLGHAAVTRADTIAFTGMRVVSFTDDKKHNAAYRMCIQR